MYRLTAAVVVAALAGFGVGFVWWGLPLDRLRQDVDRLAERAANIGAVDREVARLKNRLATAEAELARERALGARLELPPR